MGKEKPAAAGAKKDEKKDAKDAKGAPAAAAAAGGKDDKGKGKKGKGKGGDAPTQPKVEKKIKIKSDDFVELTAGQKKKQRKEKYVEKLRKLLHEYKNALIVTVDFVGSSQMQQVRVALRGKAVIIMGKNTVIRKIMREEAARNPKLAELVSLVQGNMGFVFTNGSLPEIRKILQANRVPAAAKVGNYAPEDVWIQAGPTGLDPGQTAFFQALNINTKIARGTIEIINKVHLVKKGERVNSSHVGLLAKLDLKPFSYGIVVTHAYENGSVYKAEVLDMTQDDLFQKWLRAVRFVAAMSLAVGYPTMASVPHSISNAFRKLVAISFETGYDFKEALAFKESASKKKEEPEEEEEEEEEKEAEEEEPEESDGEIGAGALFGNDDDEDGPKKKKEEAEEEEEEEEEAEKGGDKEKEDEEEEEEEADKEKEADKEEEGGEEEEEEEEE